MRSCIFGYEVAQLGARRWESIEESHFEPLDERDFLFSTVTIPPREMWEETFN